MAPKCKGRTGQSRCNCNCCTEQKHFLETNVPRGVINRKWTLPWQVGFQASTWRAAHLDIKLWGLVLPRPFLSSGRSWQNRNASVLRPSSPSAALCLLVAAERGPWRRGSPAAVYQWKSNIVHEQRSGNQYFITKLLVQMKRHGRGDFFFFLAVFLEQGVERNHCQESGQVQG